VGSVEDEVLDQFSDAALELGVAGDERVVAARPVG
jgi:hypothetical protein